MLRNFFLIVILISFFTNAGLAQKELKKSRYDNGYILDGFPRTVAQAEAFDEILDDKGVDLDAFLMLKVPEEELVKRILSRGEGRTDDTEEGVKKRLSVYWEETQPVLDYYKGQEVVKEIYGVGSIDEIFSRIKKPWLKNLINRIPVSLTKLIYTDNYLLEPFKSSFR